MSDEPATVDRDKLRAAIRGLGPEYVFYMLDQAIDLLPVAALEGIAKRYIDPNKLPSVPSSTKHSPESLTDNRVDNPKAASHE